MVVLKIIQDISSNEMIMLAIWVLIVVFNIWIGVRNTTRQIKDGSYSRHQYMYDYKNNCPYPPEEPPEKKRGKR